jgi:hypothetical protein
VLELTRTPHGVQPNFLVAACDGAQAPQRVIQPIAVEHGHDGNRLVVSLGFAQVLEQLGPTLMARAVFANRVKSCLHRPIS